MIKDYLMEEWRPDLIMAYLQEMKPQNLRVNISSPTIKGQTDKIEPVYGTEFSVEALETITPRECVVDVPPPNIFFADNVDLIPEPSKEHPE